MTGYRDICPPERCTGCMACANSCSHQAIKLTENELGFVYPKIDPGKCTGCGLCSTVCPELNPRELVFPHRCYAGALKSREGLEASASGGAAAAFSEAVLARGGVVCGCTGEDLPHARHIIIDRREDVGRLCGSKYVQSSISEDLYRELRGYLNSGVPVLFIGTGCQVAGLQNFLRKPYDNLLTVDLVCHGVPSQKMLEENMALYPGIVRDSVRFRVKENTPKPDGSAIRYGWFYKTSHTGGALLMKPWDEDPYLAAFMDCVSFRDCCYSCRYAYSARQSDVSICDFWGLSPESRLSGSLGVSAILCNNAKGERALEMLSEIMELEERSCQEAVTGNGQLMRPSERPGYRERFVALYKSEGFAKAVAETTFAKSAARKRYERRLHQAMRPYVLAGKLKSALKKLF